MTTDTITKTVFFAVQRDIVWSYLTDKDKLGTWFYPATADLQEGMDYELVKPDEADNQTAICWGTVQHFEPPEKLVWSFTIAPLNGHMTTVTWVLEDYQDGTRLTMVHEGLGDAPTDGAFAILRELDGGWDRHFGELRGKLKELQPA